MSLTVFLTAESLDPQAGAIGVVLPGLAAALESGGIGAVLGPVLGDRLESAQLIHLFGWNDTTRSAARRAKAAGTPFVVSPLGDAIEGPYRRRGWRERMTGMLGGDRLLKSATGVFGINEAEVEALRAQRVHPNVSLLPLGIDADEFAESARGHATRTLLVLGPVHPIEGLVPLLKGFAELGSAADGWNMVIAGPPVGDWRMQFEAGVRRKGGAERVRFERADDRAAQRTLLGQASIVVSAALHVRAYVSVLQAAACGVPLIATTPVAPPGMGDAIRTCRPKREDIASALHEMVTATDAVRGERARRAKNIVRRELDWSVLAPKYAKVYEISGAGVRT